ncbi:MAG: hypothetical protein J5I93_08590, partial [Pirellulaceae bacterium]|nr:hypothetical protein [Pirellulaceae bacterium]
VQAARRLAERLIPHDQATAVKLAAPAYGAGASRLREGNRAAERGEWAEAVGHWQAVVAENPDSHAALYNLALGYEALRDYRQAEQFASAALEKSDSERYREARERIQLAARQLPVVLAQRGAAPGPAPQVAPAVYRLPATEPQRMPGTPMPGTWTNPADLGCLPYAR